MWVQSKHLVGQGAMAPHILADQLSLSQPGGQTMPTTLLFAPPDFKTFLRPCLGVMLCLLISTAWARRRQPNYIYLLTDYRCLLFASPISTTCKGYLNPKLYIPSTLNTNYLLWHSQLIVCAVKLSFELFGALYMYISANKWKSHHYNSTANHH